MFRKPPSRVLYNAAQRTAAFRLAASPGGPVALREMYYSSQSSQPSAGQPKMSSPADVLNSMQPRKVKEALSSIIDGELDYDTDLGAASVNNIEAKRREARAAKMSAMTPEEIQEYDNRHLG